MKEEVDSEDDFDMGTSPPLKLNCKKLEKKEKEEEEDSEEDEDDWEEVEGKAQLKKKNSVILLCVILHFFNLQRTIVLYVG